jgi:hypothetical protein
MCIKIFENVRMTWFAAHLFCKQQNGNLVSLRIKDQMQGLFTSTGRCWMDGRKLYAPQDPLEGWQWLNGSKYNGVRRWNVVARMEGTGEEKRCATINFKDNIWQGSDCNLRRHFICRKKVCKTIEKIW